MDVTNRPGFCRNAATAPACEGFFTRARHALDATGTSDGMTYFVQGDVTAVLCEVRCIGPRGAAIRNAARPACPGGPWDAGPASRGMCTGTLRGWFRTLRALDLTAEGREAVESLIATRTARDGARLAAEG